MHYLNSIILAILQGITEFLPISSSGHLVIAQNILKGFTHTPLLFDLFLHLGTVGAILIYFRKELNFFLSKKNLFLLFWAIVATSLLAFPLNKFLDFFFNSASFASSLLILNGFLLYFTKLEKGEFHHIKLRDAFLIGLAQGIAVLPGISRSGITISMGIFLGLRKELAFKFSFFLSIPTIILGSFWEFSQNYSVLKNEFDFSYILGGLLAFLSGWLAISILFKIIKRKMFYRFSYYCTLMGIGSLIYFILRR